jgi:hypothetical protein
LGGEHPEVVRYELELEKCERAQSGTQEEDTKPDEAKPTYAHMAKLKTLLGEGHTTVKEYAERLGAYEAGRPAEEILQAKSKFIQGLDDRIAKAEKKKGVLAEAVVKAQQAVTDHEAVIAGLQAKKVVAIQDKQKALD